jgi:hypothetical protein
LHENVHQRPVERPLNRFERTVFQMTHRIFLQSASTAASDSRLDKVFNGFELPQRTVAFWQHTAALIQTETTYP